MELTTDLLKKLIAEEKAKLIKEVEAKKEKRVEDVAKKTKEVEPGREGEALENKVDYMKALNIKEAKALKVLKKIREIKSKLATEIKKEKK